MKNLDLNELEKLKEIVSGYSDIDVLKKDVDNLIEKKKEEKSTNINVRFDRNMFVKLRIFDSWELDILDLNCITNLDELINCNLDELIGITPTIKEKLDWARKFYDMSSLDDKNNNKK